VGGTPGASLASTSVTKKGFPVGGGVKTLCVPVRPGAERFHRGRREALKRDARDDLARELADRRAQRVVGAHPLVAQVRTSKRAGSLRAPAEELDQVERRLVCPVRSSMTTIADGLGERNSSKKPGRWPRAMLLPQSDPQSCPRLRPRDVEERREGPRVESGSHAPQNSRASRA